MGYPVVLWVAFSLMVENCHAVVYNGYCKILRTDRRFRLKVLNFYSGAGIGKSTIAADIFSKLKRKMSYLTAC